MKKIIKMIMIPILMLMLLINNAYAFDSSKWTLENGYNIYKGINLSRDDQQSKTIILESKNDQFFEYQNVYYGYWETTNYKKIKLTFETTPGSASVRIWEVYITQLNDSNEEISPRKFITNITSDTYAAIPSNNYVKIRFKDFEPPLEYDTVESLPMTTGNIFTTTGSFGTVISSLDGYNLTLQITYGNTVRYLLLPLAQNTDLTPFEANNAVYFTKDGTKFIAFSHDPFNASFLPDSLPNKFIPYTILNLNTLEINTFDRLNTYFYVQNEAGNNVYAYFYVDQFIMDELLSVSLAFRYQYKYMVGPNGEWQEVNTILEAGQSHRFKSTTWQSDFLSIAIPVTSVAAMIPYVRWPALLIGTVSVAWVSSTQTAWPWQFGAIDEIAKANLTPAQSNYIANKLGEADPDFIGINNRLNVYKLHLGQFNKPFSTGIVIDDNFTSENDHKGINIIQLTYVTEGQIHVVEGKDINPPIFVEGDGVGDNTAPTLPGDLIPTIIGLVIGVLIIISGVQNGAFVNRKGFNLGGTIGVLIAAILVGGLVGFIASYIMGMFIGSNALLLVT